MSETMIYVVGFALLALPFILEIITKGFDFRSLLGVFNAQYLVYVALFTVVLSHAWHILIGEASVSDFTDGQTFFALISDPPPFELSLDSAWFNTYEFTVALQMLILKGFAGLYFLGVRPDLLPRNYSDAGTVLGFILVIDAVLSFLIYGFGAVVIPDIDFQLIDFIGLVFSSFWFSTGIIAMNYFWESEY